MVMRAALGVTGPGIDVICPVVDMNMFNLCPVLRDCVRERYGPGICLAHTLHLPFLSGTCRLLTVLVENIGVALQGIHSRAFANIGHDATERGEDTASLDKLIEISGDNDVRVRIQGENIVDKILA